MKKIKLMLKSKSYAICTEQLISMQNGILERNTVIGKIVEAISIHIRWYIYRHIVLVERSKI